ncbi:MAG: hypothetical protein ACLRZG_05835 [Streptococcus sp.]
MAQAADKDIWTTAVSDYSQVTGIKLVAQMQEPRFLRVEKPALVSQS